MSQEMARQDLQNVMQEYGSYIKGAVGEKYLALTAKWQVEDLVPGLSDIDFRVVLADSAGVEDWIVVDKACGQIHSRLARKYKRWWRILEHTPGCGLTCRQMRHPYWYCSEYHTWQVCHGEPGPIQALQREYATKDWQIRDELYHLGKFLYYYSPYQQGIDPPINLGDYVDKYDMHSRCWHYFTPAMLSAAALLRKKPFPGKRTALGWLIKQFPQKDVFKKILHMVDRLYDVPENDERTLRDEFDLEMFAAFKEMRELVRRNLKFISWPENLDEKAMKQRLADDFSREKSILSLTDSVRFARIRLGRYLFFLDAPEFRTLIGLCTVPHFTTFQKAARRCEPEYIGPNAAKSSSEHSPSTS